MQLCCAAVPPAGRRTRVRCAAQSSELLPLRPLHASLCFAAPGIFQVYDASRSLAYVGLTRRLCDSLAGVADALPAALAAFATVTPLPGASGAQLQAAWRAAVADAGSVPPGNSLGADPRWTAKPRAVKQAAVQQRLPADTDVPRWRVDAVDTLISPSVVAELTARGFVVLDVSALLSPQACTAAVRACRALEPRLRAIASQESQGRRDKSAGVRLCLPADTAVTLLGGTDTAASQSQDDAALAEAAALLMALPHALRACLAADGTPSAPHLSTLAPPQSLQLALYEDGAHYSRHVDNPGPGEPSSRDGPPGWRTGDRCVTAILYFNSDWEPAHQGQLRLWPPLLAKRETPVDVEPRAGRLVLFDSRSVEHEVLVAKAPRWALSAWLPGLEAFSE
jgi:hypothetical protein